VLNPLSYSTRVTSNNFLYEMKTTAAHEYKIDRYIHNIW